jgi:hypothetical protein
MNNTCKILLFLLLALRSTNVLTGSSANSQVAKETPLMTKDLPDVPGKEGLVERVVLRARSFRRIDITQMSLRMC